MKLRIARRTGTTTAVRPLTAAVDVVAFAVMVSAAGFALGPAYGGNRWLIVVAVGAVLGAVIGAGTALLRWPVVATVATAVVGYFLIGPAVATPSSALGGFLPGPESVRLMAVGVVSGWKQMLTVADPIGSAGALLVPALLTSLIAAVVGTSIAGRTKYPLMGLVGPTLVLLVAALLGTITANHPALVGTVVAVAALGWGAWRSGGLGTAGIDIRRPVSVVALIAGAMAAALFVAPLAAPVASRVALRESVQPPFDPQTYPSPLSAFRSYVKADASTAMITVTGLPKDGRLRVATMDTYNGLFYDVSTEAGAFERVGDVVRTQSTGLPVTLHVQVDGYTGVWLPDEGSLTGIDFSGPRASTLKDTFRYSVATGTAVVNAGLKSGDTYQVSGLVPSTPEKNSLESLRSGSAPLGQVGRVPDALKAAAATLTDGKNSVYDKVDAIRSALSSRGLLNHGDTLPSPSGHGYDRLLRLMNDKKMVGDQEQFAPAMALMVQSLGIPARVVLGFAPKNYGGTGALKLTGTDMSAWVEVNFDQVGWVAFDPTPDESSVQQQAAPKPNAAPRKQVLQLPPPPRVPQDADAKDINDTTAGDAAKDKKNQDTQAAPSGGYLWVVGVAGGVPLVLILLPIIVVLWLKRRRRNRRRAALPVSQFAGGWEQVLDGAVDLGAGVPGKLTRSESAAVIDGHFGCTATLLARTADRQVFGPGDPDPVDAERFWAEVDSALSGMRGTVSPWRRLRAKLSTASLRRGDSR